MLVKKLVSNLVGAMAAMLLEFSGDFWRDMVYTDEKSARIQAM
ncbi:hypothetical protein [Paenibacillus xylanexedens]|nr:hypothetical protein [Paenibacillus xylanexedens]